MSRAHDFSTKVTEKMGRTLIRVIGAWIKKNKGPLILTNMVKDGVEVVNSTIGSKLIVLSEHK